MIKTFCDGCGKETERDYVGRPYEPTLQLNGYLYEVMVEIGNFTGDLCKECVLRIVNEGRE